MERPLVTFVFSLVFAAAAVGWVFLNLYASPVHHKIYWGSTILFGLASMWFLFRTFVELMCRWRSRAQG